MGIKKILALLEEFQAGYEARNKDAANSFVERLFMPGNSAFAVGTGSGELFAGANRIKELVSDDWEYWGDLRLDVEKARIGTEGDHGWFAVEGWVSRSFEDSAERCERYLSFVSDKVRDESMSPKTRLALVNWILSLTFSQRCPGKRDYKIPVMLSGSAQAISGEWKFAHIHFSLSRSDYPDERFEESEAFAKNYAEALTLAESYAENKLNPEIETLLKAFQSLSNNCIEQVSTFFLVGPETLSSLEDLRRLGTLSLNIGKAIASHDGMQGWLAAFGTLRIDKCEDSFFDDALARLDGLLNADIPVSGKLFAAQRLAAAALKEGSAGSVFTYPIRLTASISRSSGSWRIRQAHLSHPDYWILEGKVGAPV